ncbi:MAG: ATP-binding protein [Prolixibacteraceae bacterium]|nr:ATP-binding protein [Prolixibacteraceae bacterium]
MNFYFEISDRLINDTSLKIKRYLYEEIDWNQRLIGILGARGTGKTTLMLQKMKSIHGGGRQALYISLDRLVLQNDSLTELADWFYKQGGQYIFFDEVHKYPGWEVEIKNVYDSYPSLKIVFSGSSALLLHKAEADLSRRASIYRLHNLSLREFIIFKDGIDFQTYSLEQIINEHVDISISINRQIRPLSFFAEYLKSGAYPYYFENPVLFHDKVLTTVKTIMESDLMAISSFTYSSVISMQRVLSMLADSVPFKPNISELSRKSGVARDILLKMINLLVRADLLQVLRQESVPTGYLTKPEKLFLQNSTLAWALSKKGEPDTGAVRETFFLNQLHYSYDITLPKSGDFLVNKRYTFEIGGAGKTGKQNKGAENGSVVQDNIETGYGNIIPLWLFGFLY